MNFCQLLKFVKLNKVLQMLPIKRVQNFLKNMLFTMATFYFFWVREYLPLYKSIAEGKATTMGHIQRRHLTDSIINVPNKELMNLADSIVSPILDKIQENKIQIQTLTQTRDTLLPKLMSGKI